MYEVPEQHSDDCKLTIIILLSIANWIKSFGCHMVRAFEFQTQSGIPMFPDFERHVVFGSPLYGNFDLL